MNETFTGGCACGALRYSIVSDPRLMLNCHCRDCQQESGNGHASHLVFPRHAVTVSGVAGFWPMTADSGAVKTRAFCPTCGTPVYMTFAASPDNLSIRAGSLDDPSQFLPQIVIYRSRALHWDPPIAGLPAFDRMPTG